MQALASELRVDMDRRGDDGDDSLRCAGGGDRMSDSLARLQLDWAGPDSVEVTVRGEIDLSNADDLERELASALTPARTVTIDLREVTYIDSSGVRLLHHPRPP